MKRILTIQDLSCFGKCSLTIALPVLSAMGIEAVPLPTALLSTHTAIPGFTYRDLSGEIAPIASHWKTEKIGFDMIAVGYLGRSAVAAVREALREIELLSGGPQPFLFVDPVMGDNGKLYAGFDTSYIEEMKTLCGKADMIVPNLTEGALMTGMEYREEYDETYVREMLTRLAGITDGTVLLTGVSLRPGMTGVYGCGKGRFFVYQNEKADASYHGTGDLFASVLAGVLLRGMPVRDAAALAADFTADVIRHTAKTARDVRHGILFEDRLPHLMEKCREACPDGE